MYTCTLCAVQSYMFFSTTLYIACIMSLFVSNLELELHVIGKGELSTRNEERVDIEKAASVHHR